MFQLLDVGIIDQNKMERISSKELSIDTLLEGQPSKEKLLERLEAYLEAGTLIDALDLMKVGELYNFTKDDYARLVMPANRGLIRGTKLEPANKYSLVHMAQRGQCMTWILLKYFELNRE